MPHSPRSPIAFVVILLLASFGLVRGDEPARDPALEEVANFFPMTDLVQGSVYFGTTL